MSRIQSARELSHRASGRSLSAWTAVRLSVAMLLWPCGLFSGLSGHARAEDSLIELPARETPADAAKWRSWHRSLTPAIEEARQRKMSILVRVGAEWCGWCSKLDKEIADPQVQLELASWVLVELDADKDAADVRRMSVGPIPALRVLNMGGRVTKSHDGFLPAEKLIDWLRGQDDPAEPDLSDEVTELAELSQETLPQLVQMLGHRDANVRAAVMRQLSANQGLAGPAVVKVFMRGNLAKRLSALDLLSDWKAPTEGCDPWQPQTLTAARLNGLEDWADQLDPAAKLVTPLGIAALTPEQWVVARADIAKLVAADPSDIEAIGVHLTRYGSALLPEVREQRRAAANDQTRERLDWLRYRLVASDALVLKWPGGLTRLATTESQVRREAASALPTVATRGDEALLIELFGHPDPFVREMSLKALQGVGGVRANAELARLLSDPDANVRAAVLKQLAETPGSISVKQIADYIEQEKDQDLVVHAIRLLREIKRKEAVECLTPLFQHETWQIRAEAVEAVGALVAQHEDAGVFDGSGESHQITTAVVAEAYTEIIDALADTDGYVVSRAVLALKAGDLAIAALPLAKTAEQHPELAKSVAESLTSGSKIRVKAMPLVRAWLKHDDAALRTAALRALGNLSELDGENDVIPAMSDASESVRIVAAEHLLRLCELNRPAAEDVAFESAEPEPVEDSFLQSVFGALGGLMVKQPAVDKPAVKPDDANTNSSQEVWLMAFRLGTGRPKWMEDAKKPLKGMLKAVSAEERLAGGAALIALGDDESALPELQRIASEQRHLIPAVAKSLRWLPWEQRAVFFKQLHSPEHDLHEIATLCKELVVMRDARASSLLWEELAGEQVTPEFAQAILADMQLNHRLTGIHLGHSSMPLTPVGLKIETVKQYATSPHLWQQRVALALLLQADESAAIKVAKAIVANELAAPTSRADAFCVVLQTGSFQESNQAAVAALLDLESPLRRPALAYLTLGVAGVQSVANGEFALTRQNAAGSAQREEKKAALPKELTAQHLRPFMTSPDGETVAQAAYLLAMLGESEGIDQLIARWRKARQSNDGQPWEKLLVEAIAASDNPRYVPVIDEIYRAMTGDRAYEVRDLYWNIRTMHGPEILKLRKRIRDEVGMDQLR